MSEPTVIVTDVPGLAALAERAGYGLLAAALTNHVVFGEGFLHVFGKVWIVKTSMSVRLAENGKGGIRVDIRAPMGALTRRAVENEIAKLTETVNAWKLENDDEDGDRHLSINGLYVDRVILSGGTLTIRFHPA